MGIVVAVARLFVALGFVSLVSLGTPVHARAASNGVALSPFIQNIIIEPRDAAKTYDLMLTNQSPGVLELDLTTRDFGSLNDSGGVLLVDSAAAYAQHYGLTSWLSLETDTVILQPGESRGVLVSISNRQDLQPGGHYGAVVVSVKNIDEQTGNHVVINQQLLSLILVTKQGGDHYALKLSGVEQNGNWLHLPNDIKLHFQNPGNVHVTPRGRVLLKNPAGVVIAQGIINSESSYILPASFRDIYVRLQPTGHAVPLPGIYHTEVQYRYDGLNRTASRQYAVRFVNLPLYVGIGALLILGIVVYRRRYAKRNHGSKIAAETE